MAASPKCPSAADNRAAESPDCEPPPASNPAESAAAVPPEHEAGQNWYTRHSRQPGLKPAANREKGRSRAPSRLSTISLARTSTKMDIDLSYIGCPAIGNTPGVRLGSE